MHLQTVLFYILTTSNVLLSDNGKECVNNMLVATSSHLALKNYTTLSYIPTANGLPVFQNKKFRNSPFCEIGIRQMYPL